jgi:hypothetical protein
MIKNKTPAPTEVNGYRVVSAVDVEAGDGELSPQWIVICERPERYNASADRIYLTWLVAWNPAYNGGSYVATEGCYDLTRDEADRSLRERAFGGHRHRQYLGS